MISVNLQWVIDSLASDERSLINMPQQARETEVVKFSTDSRTIESGHVFIALQGPNFDSNAFIQDVKDKGAIAVIVDKQSPVSIPQIIVNDTLLAYGKLAAKVAESVNAKTIAITGSVGKTSVKEMCAAILQPLGNVLATQGNFNNEIGVPHTLMRLEPKHDYAVIELGANHIGEIAYTTDLTKPDVAILNNVAEAHLEGFGDIFGVVRAKGEIFNGLSQDGVAIVNGDSIHKDYWLSRLKQKFANKPEQIIQFGLGDELGGQFVSASNIKLNSLGCATFTLQLSHIKLSNKQTDEQIEIELTLPGKHNVSNALSAAAACYAVGASLSDIKSGLLNMTSVKGRVNLHQLSNNVLLIDDSYNANVQSAKAAIDLVASYHGESVFVLGDMGELGEDAKRYHQEIGEYAQQKGINQLLTLGVLSQSASSVMQQQGHHFSSHQQVISQLHQIINGSNGAISILVKGSRSAKMEQIVEQLIADINLSK